MSSKPSTGVLNDGALHSSAVLRRALLIINPHSRRGAAGDIQRVIELLRESGIEVLQVESRNADQSAEKIGAHAKQVDLIMIAGGDGTVRSVAASLYHHHKPLAILPLGTANDLARTLAIPDDPVAACRAVIKNHLRAIDLGLVNGHYFFNAVTIGLGTRITHELTPEAKKAWGVFSYLNAFFAALSRPKVFRVTITVDGRRYRQRSIHLAIGNSRYYGGGNVIADQADVDSGEFYLYSLRPQRLWKLVLLAPLLRIGKQRLTKRTFTECGRHIEISTTKPMEVHADGERVTDTPATLNIIPGAIQVFAPPGESPTTH